MFESSVPIKQGCGLCMGGVAGEVAENEPPGLVEVFSRRTLAYGGAAWMIDDVRPPARYRLYRADMDRHWVLKARDERVSFCPE